MILKVMRFFRTATEAAGVSTGRFVTKVLNLVARIMLSNFGRRYLSRWIPGPLGLRWGRVLSWTAVLEEEELEMTAGTYWTMVKAAFNAFLGPRGYRDIARRLKTCRKCPIFDPSLNRCRPYTGSNLGCGCYVPYKVTGPGPCWGKERNPQLGWD